MAERKVRVKRRVETGKIHLRLAREYVEHRLLWAWIMAGNEQRTKEGVWEGLTVTLSHTSTLGSRHTH